MVTRNCIRIIIILFFLCNANYLQSNDNNMNNYELSLTKAITLYNNKNLIIVDVRTKKEWAMTGVIPESYLINMHNDDYTENSDFINKVKEILDINKNKNISFICASGARSAIVANYFIEKNNKNISHIPDGIVGQSQDGWLYSGYPIKEYNDKEEKH